MPSTCIVQMEKSSFWINKPELHPYKCRTSINCTPINFKCDSSEFYLTLITQYCSDFFIFHYVFRTKIDDPKWDWLIYSKYKILLSKQTTYEKESFQKMRKRNPNKTGNDGYEKLNKNRKWRWLKVTMKLTFLWMLFEWTNWEYCVAFS